MLATEQERKEPQGRSSLKQSLYEDTAKLIRRIESGDIEFDTDALPGGSESVGDLAAGLVGLKTSPLNENAAPEYQESQPRLRALPIEEQEQEEQEEDEEEADDDALTAEEEAACLRQLNTDDQGLNDSNYELDSAEAASPLAFDPDFDTPCDPSPAAVDDQSAPEVDDPQTRLRKLIPAANAGDPAALDEMRKMLDEFPEIWLAIGDLALHAENAVVNLVANGNPLMSESMRRNIQQLRANLLTKDSGQLERLAAQRVIAAWIFTQHADASRANGNADQRQGAFWAKQQELAEKRFQQAVKTFGLVQKMTPPKPEQPASAAESSVAKEDESVEDNETVAEPTAESSSSNRTGCPASSPSRTSSNGRERARSITPRVNGKPLNRLAATFRRSPVPAGSAD